MVVLRKILVMLKGAIGGLTKCGLLLPFRCLILSEYEIKMDGRSGVVAEQTRALRIYSLEDYFCG